jgi:ribosomal protein S18 acetylase RimI-like enzyme
MTSILDRPIWSALLTRHAHIAEGGPRARRYDPSVSPFAATPDDSNESLEALAALGRDSESMVLNQTGEIVVPAGFTPLMIAPLAQMLLEKPLATIDDPRIVPLDWSDAGAMLALASLTKPGPFTLKALTFGDFWGIRIDGQLVAMAGERLKQPGYTELSGVCVHPDSRGKGYARLLSLFVSSRIQASGEQPYLHCLASNETAIKLYESIGFRLRAELKVAFLTRKE